MPLNIPQSTGQPSQQKNYTSQNVDKALLRKYDLDAGFLEGKVFFYTCISLCNLI